MTLLQRLRDEAESTGFRPIRDLCNEAADALLQQAEEKQYLRAENEQLKYKLSTLREYVDELERRVPHGNRATNTFD